MFNWEMPGTKHWFAASEHQKRTWRIFRVEARCTGSTLRATTTAEVVGSMANGELEARRMERRKSPRFPYQAPVEIEWGSARLRARTRDISASGMFLESDDVLWVGAGFRARLAMERPLYLECSVKRVEPGKGMGVTVALQDEQSRQFQELLAQLAARD